MCENKLQCIICSDIHMSHNDNSRNVSHTFLIDHNLSGPGRSHAQAAKQHLLLISRPPARWATGFSGDLQHNYLLLYIMFCFCNVCTIVLEINILLLLHRQQSSYLNQYRQRYKSLYTTTRPQYVKQTFKWFFLCMHHLEKWFPFYDVAEWPVSWKFH